MWGLRERLGLSIVYLGVFFYFESFVYRINLIMCLLLFCCLGMFILILEIMLGLGRYFLNIFFFFEVLLGFFSQRRDCLDYDFDDRCFRECERDCRDVDDYR